MPWIWSFYRLWLFYRTSTATEKLCKGLNYYVQSAFVVDNEARLILRRKLTGTTTRSSRLRAQTELQPAWTAVSTLLGLVSTV